MFLVKLIPGAGTKVVTVWVTVPTPRFCGGWPSGVASVVKLLVTLLPLGKVADGYTTLTVISQLLPAATGSEHGLVQVSVAGVTVGELAEQFGTPVFVIDEDDFRSRCREIADAFGGGEHVHYAGKAFLCAEIARWVAQEGLCLDVATGGELAVALHAEFPAERITVHGNNKSVVELTAAVEAGVGHIVLDSEIEIERLDAIAGEAGIVQDVLVRVTPGVEAHTHEFISTAHEDQKFGLSLASGAAMDAVRNRGSRELFTEPRLSAGVR